MSQQQIQKPHIVPRSSQLQLFQLGFEYNKTLKDVRHEVRIRTHQQ